MIAFTIHAYTTDSTEGVVITNDTTMSEEEATGYWWVKNKDKGEYPICLSANVENIFAVKQDLTEL